MSTAGNKVCIHCGTPFRPTEARPDFCCAGCQFVHALIVKNDLGQFYDLQESMGAPVKSLVFQKRDYTWLNDLVSAAENQGGPVAALELDLQGISCIGCVWLIEKVFLKKEGALSVEVNSGVGRILFRWRSGTVDITGFARELQSFGYLLAPAGKERQPESRALVTRIGLCAAFAMNAMLFTLPGYLGMTGDFPYAPLFHRLTLACGTLSFIIGGSYFFVRTWRGLRNRVLHIDLPISLGLAAAYVASVYAWSVGEWNFVYFDFVSIFVFLMLVGRWMQQNAIEKNRNRLLGLQTFVRDSDRALEPGHQYAVGPGQVIPVRSRLLSDAATLGMEWINGESEARTARVGHVVPSGAINFSQDTVRLEAIEPWLASVLHRLLETSPRDAFKDRALERFIKIYIFAVLIIGGAGFAGWLAAGQPLLSALQVLTSILVVSCPCAAGVALPLADELAVSGLRRQGVFVRESSLWTRILSIQKIIFDKTGTLTLETLALRNPTALQALSPRERQVLLHLTGDNLHPVSGCLRENLLLAGTAPLAEAGAVRETVGFGLETVTPEGTWRLGRPGWTDGAPQDAGHDCEFAMNGRVLACFGFNEEIRDDAVAEVAGWQADGVEVHILSGDRQAKVDAMAARLDLPPGQCLGELSPDAKARRVRELDRQDTLMIGDGANDSLAFNESYCTGTPAVDRGLLEHKSDFYFLGRGLNGVRSLIETAQRRRRTGRRITGFALAYNACALIACLAGHMNPLAAAILMPLSSLVSLSIAYLGSGGRPGLLRAGWKERRQRRQARAKLLAQSGKVHAGL